MTVHSPGKFDPPGAPLKLHLASVVALTTIFFLNFIARIISAPLMPSIEVDLGIGHAGAGTVFLLISAGYFVSLLGSGVVSAHLTHRKTVTISALALGAALILTSFATTISGVYLGFLLTGLASGLYLPSGLAIITSLVRPADWGKAIAVHEVAPNLSFITAPLIAELMLMFFSWRSVFALVGLASLVTGLAFARLCRGGDFPGEKPGLGALRILAAEPDFWIMLVLFILGISMTLGIYNMLPLYLVSEQGFDRGLANTYVSLSRVLCIVMALVGGWAADRFGTRQTMAVVLLVCGLLIVLLGILSGRALIVVLFLQPLAGACFFPAGIAALAAIGPQSVRNVTVSLTMPFAFLCGAGLVPAGIGLMADLGHFHLAISLMGALVALGALLTRCLKPAESGCVEAEGLAG